MSTSNPDETHLSPPPLNDNLPPSWGPPSAPLPPHKLAKLANALGVATPIPAVHHVPPSPMISNTPNGLPTPVESNYRRSPTPSPISASGLPSYGPSTSKYLLHVIPPLHLPHDSDSLDANDLIPPPPNASGYHTQFRRGILVPFFATFQAQLGAIAKEYALPSTSGLVLYLVNSKHSQSSSVSPSPIPPDFDDQEPDEPGPRLSEEIWRHLWTRVAKAEPRDDTLILPSRSPTPNIFAAPSPTPSETLPTRPLRPLIATSGFDTVQSQNSGWPVTPSTPSTVSDPRSHSKFTASEPDTPDTSTASHSFSGAIKRANSLDLPGLSSQSIIPVLAKVEFDVDRRRAVWYEPWIRSRRINHAKRAESRLGRKASLAEGAEDKDSNGGSEGKHHIELLTGTKDAATHLASLFPPQDNDTLSDDEPEADGYAPLSDSQDVPDELNKAEPEDEEDDNGEDATTRVASFMRRGGKDPLEDVFGFDADTWADIRESNSTARPTSTNPNIVNLALTGSDLEALPDGEDEAIFDASEEEVRDILQKMSSPTQPQLSVSPPTSPPSKRSSSPTSKKHVPPPLVLHRINGDNLVLPAEGTSPLPTSPATSLPYLNGPSSESQQNSPLPEQQIRREEDDLEDDHQVRSSAESDKRVGAVFEELDLGLDPTEEFDENDPHDRRKSQYLMRAQLDQIERTLARLSPRILKAPLEEEQSRSFQSNAPTLSPNPFSNNGQLSPTPLRNADVFPPTPRLPHYPDVGERMNRDSDLKGAAWPAVPFSSLNEPILATSSPPRSHNGANLPPSPPRLAVNGITTSAPKSYNPISRGPNEVSSETEMRRKALEEDQALYPPMTPSTSSSPGSPIIPLSPDPFGRYPSTPEGAGGPQPPVTYWESGRRPSVSIEGINESDGPQQPRSASRATSRFSLDSDTGIAPPPSSSSKGKEEKSANRTTLMAVKGLTKLWKKGPKASVSGPVPQPPPTPSLGSRSVSPEVPFRPSMDRGEQGIPITPTFGRFPTGGAPLVPAPPASAGGRSGGSLERRPSQEQQQQQQQQRHSHMQPQHPQQQHSLGVPTCIDPKHTMNNGMPPMPTSSGPPMPPVPMLAAQMQRGAGMRLDKFHFDQESPYPVRRYPQPPVNTESNVLTSQQQHQQQQSATEKPATATTATTPGSTVNASNTTTMATTPTSTPAPVMSSTGPRKSILKSWRGNSSSNVNDMMANNVPEPRPNVERPGAGASRPRRPSVLHFGSSSKTTTPPVPTMSPPHRPSEIPPSPQIPEQYLQHAASLKRVPTSEEHKRGGSVTSAATAAVGNATTSIMSKMGLRRSSKSRMSSSESNPPSMTSSSTASSSPSQTHQPLSSISSSIRSGSTVDSKTSSGDSWERPSLDVSQFEIVSPKLGSTLTYPYHALDHDTSR